MKNIFAVLMLSTVMFAQGLGGKAGMGGGGTGLPAITVVQHRGSYVGNTGGTDALAFSGSTASGHKLAVCWSWNATSTAITWTVADTQALTWTVDAGSRQVADATTHYSEIGSQCAYSTTTTSAAADTITLTNSAGSGINAYLGIYELSVPAVFGASNPGTGTSTTPATSSSTPSQNGAFAIASTVMDDGSGGGTNYTAGSGWTINAQGGGGNAEFGDEYQAQATAGALTGNFTSGSNAIWTASQLILIP